MVRREINKTPSGTPIAIPMSTTFFGGGECLDKDVATAERVLVNKVDAETLDGIEESFIDVEGVLVFETLSDCRGGKLLGASTSPGRLSQGLIGMWLRLKTAVSQQPAAAAWLVVFSLQQNICV